MNPRGRNLLLGAALAALSVGVFLPAVRNGFVWDDEAYVLRNPDVAEGLTPGGIARAFTTVREANWHPLTWLSHMADVTAFGMDPAGHHLVSVLLHATTVVLLFAWLLSVTGSAPGSLLVAAIFGIHPLRVESVAWVAERKDVLAGLLSVGTMAAWTAWTRRGGRARYLAATGLFAAALLAKQMAVTVPFVLLLLDVWPLGRVGKIPPGRLLLEKAPLAALSAAVSVVTWAAQSRAWAVSSSEPFPVRLANAVVSCVRYLGATAWPAGLSVFYPHPGRSLAAWQVAGSALLLASITAAALLLRRRRPALVVGWLWFLGMLVPVLGLVQVGSQAMADRYTYLPSIGLLAGLVFGVGPSLATARAGRIAGALAATAVAGLAAATVVQVGHWRDAGTLFTHALEVTGPNVVAHEQLGIVLQARGATDEAAGHYRAALAIQPTDAVALNNLGAILKGKGRMDEALDLFRQAVRRDPNLASARINLARELLRRGLKDDAAGHLAAGITLDPAEADAMVELAALRQERGRSAEAAGLLSEAERLYRGRLSASPGQFEASLDLGVLLVRRGDLAGAEAMFRQAVAADPSSAEARHDLAVVLFNRGDVAGAAAQLREGLTRNPGDARLRGALSDLSAGDAPTSVDAGGRRR